VRIRPLVVALALAGCAPASPTPRDPAAEARAFMEAYAQDLRAGNREGIADRYDRRGAYTLGNGGKRLEAYDSIAAGYRSGWQPPHSFEWRDLSYEAVGPDAVVVTGRFLWGTGSGEPMRFSYSSLLVRQDGRLRIRMEDESMDPRSVPRPACPPDSARR
jgi:hypothetical protein